MFIFGLKRLYFLLCAGYMLICFGVYFFLNRLEYTKHILLSYTNGKNESTHRTSHPPKYLEVFKDIRRYVLMVTLCYFLVLATFPGVAVLIPSTSGISPDWFAIIIIAIFNFADMITKIVASFKVFLFTPDNVLWAVVLSKLVIQPLFIVFWKKPLNDYLTFFVVLLSGATTGFIGSIAMSKGPQECNVKGQTETAGLVMAVFLILGLALGGSTSLIFTIFT